MMVTSGGEGVSEMFGDCDDNLDSEVCSKQVAGLCIEYTIIQTYTTRPSLLHPVAGPEKSSAALTWAHRLKYAGDVCLYLL